MTLLLYGIVRADHPLPAGLHAVVEDDLAVAVADLPPETELTADHARSHLDVLCGLINDGPVLPLRFGSTAADENAVRDNALRSDPAALRLELDRLTGLAEVRVRLVFDETTALTAVLDADPGLSRPVAGLDATIEQGRLISERVRAWTAKRSVELLGGMATETRPLAAAEDGAQRWALLVRHDDVDRIAESIGGAAGVSAADTLGPLPPYTFASLPTRPVSRWGFG